MTVLFLILYFSKNGRAWKSSYGWSSVRKERKENHGRIKTAHLISNMRKESMAKASASDSTSRPNTIIFYSLYTRLSPCLHILKLVDIPASFRLPDALNTNNISHVQTVETSPTFWTLVLNSKTSHMRP